MVQVDVFWSFAVGAEFAAASAGLLENNKKPLESKGFLYTVLWLSVFFVPSGATLLWMYPDWETMQVGTWASIPGWLVAGFSMTNVTQGILGFWLASLLIRKGKLYEANLLWLAGYFGMFFILIHGWDGTGYERFFYSPMAWGGEVTPWQEGTFTWTTIPAFLISPVFITLLIMGAIMFPLFFRWLRELHKLGYEAATAANSNIYAGYRHRRNPGAIISKVLGGYCVGGALVLSLCIRVAGPVLGTLVFAGVAWYFAVRRGGTLYHEFYKKDAREAVPASTSPAPAGG